MCTDETTNTHIQCMCGGDGVFVFTCAHFGKFVIMCVEHFFHVYGILFFSMWNMGLNLFFTCVDFVFSCVKYVCGSTFFMCVKYEIDGQFALSCVGNILKF